MRLLLLLLPSLAMAAAPRKLTLAEAVELGLRIDPTVLQSRIADDRAKLAVTRAQLDRVSVKIDASLAELFNKSNIGGAKLYNCMIGPISYTADPDTCSSMGGVSSLAMDQQPAQGLGTFNLAANINVPVFSGFRVESNVKRAQRLHDASLAGVTQAKKDTALSVARAYWAVRRLGLLLEVQQHTLDRLREAEAVTDGRVKAGLAPPIDKNRATVRRLQQLAAIADQRGQMRESAVQLAVALGLREDVELTDDPRIPATVTPEIASWETLADAARAQRPEIKTARQQSEAARFAVKMAESNYYPQLNALLLFQLGNNAYNPLSGARSVNDAANPFAGVSGTLTTGFNLSMNLFDTLNTWTSTRDAKYEHSRLLEEERRARRVVEGDVRATHARLMRLYDRRGILAEARDVAADNLKIIEGRYKNGDALVIEYLDGQSELNQTELDLADNTAQLQVAWLELDAALGKIVGVD